MLGSTWVGTSQDSAVVAENNFPRTRRKRCVWRLVCVAGTFPPPNVHLSRQLGDPRFVTSAKKRRHHQFSSGLWENKTWASTSFLAVFSCKSITTFSFTRFLIPFARLPCYTTPDPRPRSPTPFTFSPSTRLSDAFHLHSSKTLEYRPEKREENGVCTLVRLLCSDQ